MSSSLNTFSPSSKLAGICLIINPRILVKAHYRTHPHAIFFPHKFVIAYPDLSPSAYKDLFYPHKRGLTAMDLCKFSF